MRKKERARERDKRNERKRGNERTRESARDRFLEQKTGRLTGVPHAILYVQQLTLKAVVQNHYCVCVCWSGGNKVGSQPHNAEPHGRVVYVVVTTGQSSRLIYITASPFM